MSTTTGTLDDAGASHAGDLPASAADMNKFLDSSNSIDSFSYRNGPSKETIDSLFRTAEEVHRTGVPDTRFLVDEMLPEASLALLTGAPKGGGKSTLATHMAAALVRGEPFIGRNTVRTRVVYLTEQSESNFNNEYLRPVGLEDSADVSLLYAYQVAGRSWEEIVHAAVERCLRVGAKVLFVDTFLQFARLKPEQENDAAVVQAFMRPLQYAVARHRITIVVVHHDRKSGGEAHSSGRGSSAFQASADLIIQVKHPGGNYSPNIREICFLGRFGSRIPASVYVEFADDTYVYRGDSRAVSKSRAREIALQVLSDEERNAKSPGELLRLARAEDEGVKETTFKQALRDLHDEGLVARRGSGRRGDPWQFWKL